MSGRKDKLRRRQLRRALGTEAVQHVDAVAEQLVDITAAMNNRVVPNLNTLNAGLLEQAKTIRELQRRLASLEELKTRRIVLAT